IRIVPSVLGEYVDAFLQSKFARMYFWRRAKGLAGSMPKIDQETIMRLPLALPPKLEQEQIVKEVEERLSVIAAAETQIDEDLRRAVRLRQSILRRAFEGRLVPQDPKDEPAAKLLERIRLAPSAHAKQSSTRTRTG